MISNENVKTKKKIYTAINDLPITWIGIWETVFPGFLLYWVKIGKLYPCLEGHFEEWVWYRWSAYTCCFQQIKYWNLKNMYKYSNKIVSSLLGILRKIFKRIFK